MKSKTYLALQVALIFSSLSGVCSKFAAQEVFLSLRFCAFYGGVLAFLGMYALIWQKVLQQLPLSVAYANTAVSGLWSIVWGWLFFRETITPGKLAGISMVIMGVILYSNVGGKCADG